MNERPVTVRELALVNDCNWRYPDIRATFHSTSPECRALVVTSTRGAPGAPLPRPARRRGFSWWDGNRAPRH